MCRNADGAPFFRFLKVLDDVVFSRRRRCMIVVNSTVTYYSLKRRGVSVGVEQAQEMNAVFGHGLEARQYEDPGSAGSLHQALRGPHLVVIRYRNNLDSVRLAGFDDSGVVRDLVSESGGLAMLPEVGKR